ncbi:GerMN domain-containing protein [Streptomyces sp. E-08]|uniref:GerMN domain-containing protein n=1 Tax=Streptomyces sp. E-08 TaxID=3404047 RepID=UPI003CE77FA3
MTRRPAALMLPAAALAAVLTSCGVQPSGVIGAGEPPTGLTKGLRLYFVSATGHLEGVSRPDTELTGLDAALKLLVAGPTEPEQKRGLTTLVSRISYDTTAEATRVTLRSAGTTFSGNRRDDLINGQLVCTLARAQSTLHPAIRPDDVQVTLIGDGRPAGPYRCSQFMGG